MYTLRNATGNVVRRTESRRKREELLAMGYVEVAVGAASAPSQPPAAKKKAAKKEGKA